MSWVVFFSSIPAFEPISCPFGDCSFDFWLYIILSSVCQCVYLYCLSVHGVASVCQPIAKVVMSALKVSQSLGLHVRQRERESSTAILKALCRPCYADSYTSTHTNWLVHVVIDRPTDRRPTNRSKLRIIISFVYRPAGQLTCLSFPARPSQWSGLTLS